jgi:hypothetical protein
MLLEVNPGHLIKHLDIARFDREALVENGESAVGLAAHAEVPALDQILFPSAATEMKK